MIRKIFTIVSGRSNNKGGVYQRSWDIFVMILSKYSTQDYASAKEISDPRLSLSSIPNIICTCTDTWSGTFYTVLCTMYTVLCTIYTVQCTMYNVQCTMYNVHCTMYNVQCTLYIVQCTMYSVQCTLYNVQMYNVHCTMYNVQCTMYTVLCTKYSSCLTLDCLNPSSSWRAPYLFFRSV